MSWLDEFAKHLEEVSSEEFLARSKKAGILLIPVTSNYLTETKIPTAYYSQVSYQARSCQKVLVRSESELVA